MKQILILETFVFIFLQCELCREWWSIYINWVSKLRLNQSLEYMFDLGPGAAQSAIIIIGIEEDNVDDHG